MKRRNPGAWETQMLREAFPEEFIAKDIQKVAKHLDNIVMELRKEYDRRMVDDKRETFEALEVFQNELKSLASELVCIKEFLRLK
jgi:hypothetical protein